MTTRSLKTHESDSAHGVQMHALATQLFPICRSLSGPGVRQTLDILKEHMPGLTVHEVPTGTQAFDWTVPREWSIREAYIEHESGERVVDFADHNLHVVSYSTPISEVMSREQLDAHLHSLPEQPDAIPYVTSYYKERWGFCMAHTKRESLPEGQYKVHIDSTLEPGNLTYGELIIPGETEEEVLLSTYVCHPSMANNELSGPVVTTELVKLIQSWPDRRYTYRIVFVPETIGAIIYLSRNHEQMCARTIAGFVMTCVGDERAYSFMPSRRGDTLADRVARRVLNDHAPDYIPYSFLQRGSDERQYCSPHIDLPVVSIMRSKYGVYPEYHTSLDDLELVTSAGLQGAYDQIARCLVALENNANYQVTVPCEPQLGKRGLYPTLSIKGSSQRMRHMLNLLAYADGERDLLQLSEVTQVPLEACYTILNTLIENGLVNKATP